MDKKEPFGILEVVRQRDNGPKYFLTWKQYPGSRGKGVVEGHTSSGMRFGFLIRVNDHGEPILTVRNSDGNLIEVPLLIRQWDFV